MEGAHLAFKKYLKVSTMGLWDVCNKIDLAYLNSVAELRPAIGGCVIKVWNDHMDNFFAGVVQFVLRYALVKVHEQMLLLDDPALCQQNLLWSFEHHIRVTVRAQNCLAKDLGQSTPYR